MTFHMTLDFHILSISLLHILCKMACAIHENEALGMLKAMPITQLSCVLHGINE